MQVKRSTQAANYRTDVYRQKHREWEREWRKANREKARATDKRYRKAHPVEKAASLKVWRAANREKIRQDKRTWTAAHPGSNNERAKRWEAANHEKAKAGRRNSSQRWAAANPEKRALYHSRGHVKRKARLKDVGIFSLQEWQALLNQAGHKCACCGIPESEAIYRFRSRGEPLRGQLTRDHVVPLCKGGRGTIDNIQPLCLPCNTHKHDRTIDYRRSGVR